MAILIGNAVLHKDVLNHLKHFITSKWLLAFSLIFFIYLLSGLYSDGSEEWLKHVRLKLPFLLLPFSFTALRRISKNEFSFLLFLFVCICSISAGPVLWKYFGAYHEINDSYLRAQVLPTPISHIRYSLLLTLAVLSSIWLYINVRFSLLIKYGGLIMGLFLFAFVHVLAVRSGLLALYSSLAFVLIYFTLVSKKWWLAIVGLLSIVIIPVIAWFALPTFQNKIKYAQWDLGIFNSNQDRSQYSDSRRILSWQLAIDQFSSTPVLGAGIGDLRAAMDSRYQDINPSIKEIDRIMPHNQWLYILSGTGLVGLLLFLLSQFYVLFGYGLWKHWIYVAFYIVLSTSFIAESTLEAQLGVGIYTLFVLMSAQYFIPDKINLDPVRLWE